MTISLIIPAYNASGDISEVLKRIPSCVKEVIVVDDCSADNTADIAKSFGAKVIIHERNKGKGAAIRTGVSHASGSVIVMMDADNQHDPAEISRLAEPVMNGEAELVIGARRLSHIPLARRLYNLVVYMLILVFLRKNIKDPLSGFRVIGHSSMDRLGLKTDGYEIDPEIIFEAVKKGLHIKNMPISISYKKGTSNINFIKALSLIAFIIKGCIKNAKL